MSTTTTTTSTSTTAAIAERLRRMKDGALQATRDNDVAYYDAYVADDALGIFPYGTFDKAAVLAQVARPQPSFRALGIEDEQVVVLSPDCGLVTYTALYPHHRVATSTLFLRRHGRWQAVLYQQTPLDTPT
jgi:hypothetical protein